jgi:ribosomal protein S18 acetylase RimI-like enzyme
VALELRAATEADIPRIAEIWEPAWRDGHLGGVPDELVRVRTPENFVQRSTAIQPHTTLAVVDGSVVGFVATADDEIDQLFVDAAARGLGIADILLRAGEEQIAAAGHSDAWLAVVDGGEFSYTTDAPGGTIEVPCRRYLKPLTATPAG